MSDLYRRRLKTLLLCSVILAWFSDDEGTLSECSDEYVQSEMDSEDEADDEDEEEYEGRHV